MLSRLLLAVVLIVIVAGTTAYVCSASMNAQSISLSGTVDNGTLFDPEEITLGPTDGNMLRYAGHQDTRNIYSSAVMITTGNPEHGAQCSGVLLSPSHVLTAGSCVCDPRQSSSDNGAGYVIDSLNCSRRAYITTSIHNTTQQQNIPETRIKLYEGFVRPHPDMKILLDASLLMVTSHADLAVVSLDKPIEGEASHVSLADSEVSSNESIITAGYGHDKRVRQVPGQRYFRKNKVVHAPAMGEDSFSYIQMESDIHSNHGGWPCFRNDGKAYLLTGVSDKVAGENLSCVSTHIYRKWLTAEIARLTKNGDMPQ